MSEKIESKMIIGFGDDYIEIGEKLKDGSVLIKKKLDLTGKKILIFSGNKGTGKTRALNFMKKIDGNLCVDEVSGEEFEKDFFGIAAAILSPRPNGIPYVKRVIAATQEKAEDIKIPECFRLDEVGIIEVTE
jgi:hypothetical protein